MGEEHLTSSRGLMRVALSAKNMAEAWIEAIGLLAGVIGIIAWIPQIIQVWVHKRHDGISLATFAVVSFALGLWLLYGILVDSFAMIAANIMTLTVIGAVIIGVYRVRKSEAESQL
jgi:MtN3 and saliva related transmembrane protein